MPVNSARLPTLLNNKSRRGMLGPSIVQRRTGREFPTGIIS